MKTRKPTKKSEQEFFFRGKTEEISRGTKQRNWIGEQKGRNPTWVAWKLELSLLVGFSHDFKPSYRL